MGRRRRGQAQFPLPAGTYLATPRAGRHTVNYAYGSPPASRQPTWPHRRPVAVPVRIWILLWRFPYLVPGIFPGGSLRRSGAKSLGFVAGVVTPATGYPARAAPALKVRR